MLLTKTYRFPFITEGHRYEFGNTIDMLGDSQLPFDRTDDIYHKWAFMINWCIEEDITMTMLPNVEPNVPHKTTRNGLCYNRYVFTFKDEETMSRFESACNWLVPIVSEEDNIWQRTYDDLLKTYRYSYIVDGCKIMEVNNDVQ